MSLSTKLKTFISSDYKSINCRDITGTGITGYGNNQNPIGKRLLQLDGSISGDNVGLLKITDPLDNLYSFKFGNTAIGTLWYSNVYVQDYNILNTSLGTETDYFIRDGIWKSESIIFFLNSTLSNSSPIIYLDNTKNYIEFENNYPTYFTNCNYIYVPYGSYGTLPTLLNPSYIYKVTSIQENKLYIEGNTYPLSDGSKYANQYFVGYSAVKYFVSAKAIRDCLNEKIAALPNSNCPCKEKQVNKLMNMCMLYDGMMINAENGNPTKAQYLFDILTNYCSDSDCKCND